MACTSGPAAGFFFISWFSISHSLVKYLACIAVTFFLYFIADFNTSEVTMLVFDLL